MDRITTILLGLFASIAFYFIELEVIRIFIIAKIKGSRKLNNQKKNEQETIYYLTIKNESKRRDAFNVRVYVEFLNEQEKPVGYFEQRVFPYVGRKQGNVYYPLFSGIPKEKRIESMTKLLERSKKMHVVITCQNQFGKNKKTDEFIAKIVEENEPVEIFDFQS